MAQNKQKVYINIYVVILLLFLHRQIVIIVIEYKNNQFF